jgi:hypothetical protein
MAKDVELFRAAMAGVKPLKGQPKGRKPAAVIPRPKAEGSLPAPERSPAPLGMTKVSVQTPQAFEAGILRRALAGNVATATDDAMLVEAVGGRVRIVESTARNFKITWPEDLERAESLLC